MFIYKNLKGNNKVILFCTFIFDLKYYLFISFFPDANLNQHALRSNKYYRNTCPRKLKFIFLIENPNPTSINEMQTKGIK